MELLKYCTSFKRVVYPGDFEKKRLPGFLPSHSSFDCLRLCLYFACLRKSTEKAKVKRQPFINKIARVHSSPKRNVNLEFSSRTDLQFLFGNQVPQAEHVHYFFGNFLAQNVRHRISTFQRGQNFLTFPDKD